MLLALLWLSLLLNALTFLNLLHIAEKLLNIKDVLLLSFQPKLLAFSSEVVIGALQPQINLILLFAAEHRFDSRRVTVGHRRLFPHFFELRALNCVAMSDQRLDIFHLVGGGRQTQVSTLGLDVVSAQLQPLLEKLVLRHPKFVCEVAVDFGLFVGVCGGVLGGVSAGAALGVPHFEATFCEVARLREESGRAGCCPRQRDKSGEHI